MNKICTNYCYNIVQNYLGYNVGIPVDYTADEKILDFLAYNDESDKTNRLFRDALIFGHSYELSYIDENKKNRFDVVDPRFGIDVYKDSLESDELKAFIRLYCEQYINEANSIWKIEVYDSKEVNIYTSDSNFDKLAYVETRPHNFSQVPVVVFNLNQERQGIFEQVTSLQDAYNNLVSDQIDDADAFSDAYMVLKGVSPDKELADQIKQDKILFMDSDASAGYLTKQVNDSQVKNMLDTIRESIYKITNTVNGWVYIGSTLADKIETQLKGHFKSARLGVESNLMYTDMREQKNEDFTIELIDTCEPRHRFMIEEWYTRDAFKKYDKVYNKKSTKKKTSSGAKKKTRK